MAAQAFFLPATPGQRFCIHHSPAADSPVRGAVLYLHPWAEEMNKSRRMAALHARALAAAGYAVLQIDLHGCGDSSDSWAQASWAGWVDDAVLAARWLLQRHPAQAEQPLWLWGLRAGALLAADASHRLAAELKTPCNFLFWQPSASGKLLLQQFLRLKTAAGLQAQSQASGKETMAALRAGLAAGQAQDIAGYALSPGLAQGLEAATLTPPAALGPDAIPGAEKDANESAGERTNGNVGQASRVIWLEVSGRPEATVLPASQQSIAQWQAAGYRVHTQVVNGPAFWQTVEIEDAPALLQASLSCMTTALASGGMAARTGTHTGPGQSAQSPDTRLKVQA